MKTISNNLLFAYFIVLLTILAPSVVHASVTTRFCMELTHTHGGSDSTNIYVDLTGSSNTSTGKLKLNNPGTNDFIKGKWSCFGFEPSDLPNGADVGFHIKAEVGFNPGDQDDFCVKRVVSERLEGGKLLSRSEFGSNREMCFGNYNNNSKSKRILNTTSKRPIAKVRAVEMRWKKVGSAFGKGTLNYSTTWGAERSEEKTTTKQWEVAVSVEAKASAKILGTGGEVTTSVTASGGESYGLNEAVSKSEAQTISQTCHNDGEATTVTLYQWEYKVKHSDGTGDVKIPVKSFACVKNNPDPANFFPVCLPGCCDNAACTQCKSGRGFESCKAIVNPRWYEAKSVQREVTGQQLNVSKQAQPAAVNLTAAGTTDWVSWICSRGNSNASCQGHHPRDANPYARKNVRPVIGNVVLDSATDSGGNAALRYLQGGSLSVNWTDGDPRTIWSGDGASHTSGVANSGLLQWCPDAGCPGTSPGGAAGGTGTSFTFPVTAISNNPSTLNLYVGGFRAMGRLTVTLPGSAPVILDHNFGTKGADLNLQINFTAARIGDVLTAKWEQVSSAGNSSNLWVKAVTLR